MALGPQSRGILSWKDGFSLSQALLDEEDVIQERLGNTGKQLRAIWCSKDLAQMNWLMYIDSYDMNCGALYLTPEAIVLFHSWMISDKISVFTQHAWSGRCQISSSYTAIFAAEKEC